METRTPTDPPVSCPKCGVAKVEKVRQEHGTKGQWHYYWVEFLECRGCGARLFPASGATVTPTQTG